MTAPMPAPRRGRLALVGSCGVLAAWWVMYALVAAWTPWQGNDWNQLAWLRHRQPIDARDVLDFVGTNPSLGDVVGQLGVAHPWAYVLVTPTVIILLVLGLHALAFSRTPSLRSPRDLLHLAALHALIWTGAARVGVTLGHRPHVAHFVYGLCAMVWLLAAVRACGERPRGGAARAAGMFVLGLAAGASNHHIGLLGLIAVIVTLVRRRRRGAPVPVWMVVAAVGIALGLAALFSNPTPYFAALGRRGFSSTFGQLVMFFTEGAETMALTTLTAFAMLLRSRLAGVPMPIPTASELRWMATCFFAGFALVLVAMFGPRWGEPAMFAPAVLFVAGAVVALARLADDRYIRVGLLVFVIGVHAVVAVQLLPTYRQADQDMQVRLAQLKAAPADGVATITPFQQVATSFWFYGEDLGRVTGREVAAIEVFGLRDLRFDRETGVYEPSTGFEMTMSIELDPPAPPAELARAIAPRIGTSLMVARTQWRRAMYELGSRHNLVHSTLEITNLEFEGRRGRRVFAGKLVPQIGLISPRSDWRQPDPLQRMSFMVRWKSLRMQPTELFVVGMGDNLPVERDGDKVYFVPTWAGAYTLIACDAVECLAVETAWARY